MYSEWCAVQWMLGIGKNEKPSYHYHYKYSLILLVELSETIVAL